MAMCMEMWILRGVKMWYIGTQAILVTFILDAESTFRLRRFAQEGKCGSVSPAFTILRGSPPGGATCM